MNDGLARQRVITWHDPLETARTGRGQPGIEFLRAIVEGAIPQPPIAATLGFRLADVGEGRAVFILSCGEHLYNPIGTVHGGVAATLLDSAMGCAVHSTLPAGLVYTTLEFKVNFVRPLTRDSGEARCEGTVIYRGNRQATAEGKLYDAAGRLCAHATTTCMIFAA